MWWFRKKARSLTSYTVYESPPFTAALAPLHRVAIVGDIHGRYDLLEKLLFKLENEQPDYIVCVGDFIDRGPKSKAVLMRLVEEQKANDRMVCLMGNHEKMMIDFLDNPAKYGARWLRHGGAQTLISFGLRRNAQGKAEDDFMELRNELRRELTAETESWLRNLPCSWNTGNLWVVHAGASPKVSMEEQDPKILLWGDTDFADINRDDNNWVAFGHTIVDKAVAIEGRIPVDTGAYKTGVLTAAVLDPEGEPKFVRAS